MNTATIKLLAGAGVVAMTGACATVPAEPGAYDSLPVVAEVSPRFQSYNVEMVEVTGGEFWAPYDGPAEEVYRNRPPIDLTNPKLVALTRNLGPAYMRVSGTWANKTYLPLEGETITDPPEGYDGILTRDQWRGVLRFSEAVDAPILVSFAVGPGPRDENGVWETDQAQRVADLTRESGGSIAAVEFFNEPNAAFLSSLPKDYSADNYLRDFNIFHDWARTSLPDAKIFGMGNVNEGSTGDEAPVAMRGLSILFSRLVMPRLAGQLDGVSFHHYGTISQRCAGRSRLQPAKIEDALTPEWLDGNLVDLNYYRELRDQYEPGDPLWITETAQAACGGSPWASTFLDTFRYVSQLGSHAREGVDAVFHNTLAASDYALIDDETLDPRPNYWAAVLWSRLMGTKVLAAPQSPSPELRLYAHCGKNGEGIAIAAVNTGGTTQTMPSGRNAQSWTMSATELTNETIMVNGRAPALAADGALTGLDGVASPGSFTVPGRSVVFVSMPDARNPACS